MPATVEALMIALLFITPGLLFERGVEIRVGYWRTSITERVLRFLLWSVALQVAVAPISYLIWRPWLEGNPVTSISVLVLGLEWFWTVVLLGLSYMAGLAVGSAAAKSKSWTKWVLGRAPAPTAWDHLWMRGEEGYVRLKLTGGGFVGGLWQSENNAFASSHPHTPADLFLSRQVVIDPETGEIECGEAGDPIVRDWGLLVRYDEIERLEFQTFQHNRIGEGKDNRMKNAPDTTSHKGYTPNPTDPRAGEGSTDRGYTPKPSGNTEKPPPPRDPGPAVPTPDRGERSET